MKHKCFAICGSHGVGKTTIIEELKKHHPEYVYIDESTRIILPQLGFSNPYDFVEKYGISYYESIIISQWAIISLIYDRIDCPIILDRSPIDNLAYYYMLRKDYENKYESVLIRLCEIYCKYIDTYLFVPTGVFDLKPDIMQVKETQKKLEGIIKILLHRFQIKYHIITQKTIYGRCKEVEEKVEEMYHV